MKKFTSVILFILLIILSTNIIGYTPHEKRLEKLCLKESAGTKHKQSTDTTSANKLKNNKYTIELSKVFSKTVKKFPNDSSMLCTIYYNWHKAKDTNDLKSQIQDLKYLISKKTVDRYNNVTKYLKPLLKHIVRANCATVSQADSLKILYSDYDDLSGQGLFTKLLTNKENYNLVWKSLGIIANSRKDTSYISIMISLNNHIRTNAELAESMPNFVLSTIKSNPKGFLEMYSKRHGVHRTNFAKYVAPYDEPDINLIKTFKVISQKSTSEVYRNAASEIFQKYKKWYLTHKVPLKKKKVLKPDVGKVFNYTQAQEKEWLRIIRLDKEIDENKINNDSISDNDKHLLNELILGDGPITVGTSQNMDSGGPYKIVTSSTLPADKNGHYKSNHVHDLNVLSAWGTGRNHDGVGESIEFYFKPFIKQNTLLIYDGYLRNRKLWKEYSRVKEFQLYINNKPFKILDLADTNGIQLFTIPPVQSKTKGVDLVMKFKILSVYKGSKYSSVMVSEIDFACVDKMP